MEVEKGETKVADDKKIPLDFNDRKPVDTDTC